MLSSDDPVQVFQDFATVDLLSGGRAEIMAGRGSFIVGSPQEVIDKILYEYQLFHNERVLIQFSVGTLPHAKIMRSIELLGTEVAPVVRRETAPSPSGLSAR